jgi:hypothetical protein
VRSFWRIFSVARNFIPSMLERLSSPCSSRSYPTRTGKLLVPTNITFTRVSHEPPRNQRPRTHHQFTKWNNFTIWPDHFHLLPHHLGYVLIHSLQLLQFKVRADSKPKLVFQTPLSVPIARRPTIAAIDVWNLIVEILRRLGINANAEWELADFRQFILNNGLKDLVYLFWTKLVVVGANSSNIE